ncbi:MAG: ABC transporter ATP-binding protein [Candidatus Azotimanducaceae bacterium]|uniref:ATP-binding cassette domain-containing protein n=1 Tax=OM182 bacterium TaxID=2510334 RepID=A0A520S304_9GAMM|nr:ABC transporter ATP-binding protein [Gammaproteobacteria bacterium]OUV66996.1 MAG: ABC transporter ATP-binding protein [Gammaproteobacteria bacterium TMED133]RZO76855.1 MAG: ATP-binding cassette domain-containing protein [OM182 bacterium]
MIEITELRKQFGDLVAVDGLSFSVEAGEVLGFLGPNGAGKSTTMKIITGFLPPSDGVVKIFGHNISSHPLNAQKIIGYLPEGAPCYEEMTPRSFLKFIAEIRGFVGSELEHRVRRVVDTLSLQSVLDRRIETLSKGFKRRVGFAQAIIHDPLVLILDEPTDGLDPNQKHHVRELIREFSKDKIVIISTHILEEVATVCNRAVIIASGRMVADCSPEELEAKSPRHLAVRVTANTKDLEAIERHMEKLASVHEIQRSGSDLLLIPSALNSNLLVDLFEGQHKNKWAIEGLSQEKGRLDEVFRSITEGFGNV